MRRIVSELC